MGVHIIQGELDRSNFFGFFIRDLNAKLFFQRHHQLNRIQGIGTQVIHERGFVLDFRLVHAQLFSDDFLDTLFIVDIALLPKS